MAASSSVTGDEAAASPWRRFALMLGGGGLALLLGLVAALVLLDPYDTGRPGLFPARGLLNPDAFAANMTRARDPRFNAAIVGNSHVQLLQPARLDALTGLSFVSLTLPGTFSGDHLDVMRIFATRHPVPPRAIILGIDQWWCEERVNRSEHFPPWLYAEAFGDYLVGLVRFHSLKVARYRLRNLIKPPRNGLRPDGFFDYEPIYQELGLADFAASGARLAAPKPFPVNATGRFPSVEALRRALAALPATTPVLLVRTPVYRTALPDPATPQGANAEACRVALASAAASRPGTAFVDVLSEGRFAAEPRNFYDHDHYRDPVAAKIEREVAAALAKLIDAMPRS